MRLWLGLVNEGAVTCSETFQSRADEASSNCMSSPTSCDETPSSRTSSCKSNRDDIEDLRDSAEDTRDRIEDPRDDRECRRDDAKDLGDTTETVARMKRRRLRRDARSASETFEMKAAGLRGAVMVGGGSSEGGEADLSTMSQSRRLTRRKERTRNGECAC